MKQLLISNKARTILVLLFLLFSYTSFAQSLVVQGVVRDDKGVIPGATVKVQGQTNTAVLTNVSGAYKINASAGAILEISFIGYNTRQISLKDFKANQGVYTIDVDLETSNSNLNEVVVVGFGTQKKIDLTGSVATISGKALEDRPVVNVLQSLEGMVPGLNITQTNGAFDSPPSINVRGIGSISSASSASPLILIDGMDGSLTALNPDDIESITVLKDAAASSIYGSRAAFGVILVTTKKGKAGNVRVTYSNNFHYTSPVALPKSVDSYTFALAFNEADANGNSAPIFDAPHLQRIQDYLSGKITTTDIPNPTAAPGTIPQWADGYAYGNDNVDWYKTSFASSVFSQEHNLSISGGDAKTTYYLSGNYLGQQGLLTFSPDLYKRYGLSAKINTKISDYVSLNYGLREAREERQQPGAEGAGFYENLGRQGWPTLPLYDPNGYLFNAPSFALGLRDGGLNKHQQDLLDQQLSLVIEPIKGWKTIAELHYTTMNYFDHSDSQVTYNHDTAGNPIVSSSGSSVSETAHKENNYLGNFTTSYEKNINKHYFHVLVGSQIQSFQYRDVMASRQGIIVPDLPTINTTSGVSATGLVVPPSVSGQYQDWATLGYFGRLNYSFDDKYLFEANLRYDGSSRFRAANRWIYLPSFSGGWVVSKENFFKDNVKFMDLLKFRASYGSIGNTNTNSYYPTYITIPVQSANGGWLVNGAQPNVASAPQPVSTSLTWETVKTLNLAVDFGFLNNRLNGSFDWFDRKTLNMLGPAVELPVTYGVGVPPTNNTDLKTDGWELSVNWNDRMQNGLGYGFGLSLSDNQTTITRYPNPTGLLSTYIAGQKTGNIYGYTTLGIAKTQAEMDAHLATSSNGQTFFGSAWGAGDIMYADINGDGKIDNGANTLANHGDLKVIGNNTPRYNVGFNMHFDYKGFDMSAFWQGVLKQDYWAGGTVGNNNNYYFWGITDNVYFSTMLQGQQMNFFRGDPNDPLGQNLNSYFPRPIFGTNKNHFSQTAYLINAAYLRLKNLQIGYTIPGAVLKSIGIQKLRVYMSGDNLFTITKVPPQFDPETISGGQTGDSGRGQGNAYPLTKVISFGLNVTF